MKNTTLLDKIIFGRIKPHIYAFKTNTVPEHLKIGDTYRPVNIRLKEWKMIYPDLTKEFEESSMVNEDTFFRDYSVHQYLENDLNKVRINPIEFKDVEYISNEFFKDVQVSDISDAILDIKKSFEQNLMKYKYYNSVTSNQISDKYDSTGMWTPRPNQQDVINNFKQAISNGRNNLLMYAVMRFGKSFTAMCCANEMNAQIVVIVSAKADVKDEWKKTIQSADNFSEYTFITSYDLNEEGIISSILDSNKKVALFLTLQDLQGREIKERHKELFQSKIDLLLIDETHFGARAEKYGAVLRNVPLDVKESREDTFVDYDEADKCVKILSAKVKIHLSGTPYRILMGSEFEKDDIIAFCQFPDIVEAQEEWDIINLNNDDVNEWDNPYYGFPQMVRFAFNPSSSVRARLEELKNEGMTYAFSELLRPQSIEKDESGKHLKFKYESEVLELLEVIDGSKEDEEVLSFLDYPKIKEGKMCRHMVMVLPFCASCDCVENLIINNKDKFKNLNEYEIINISGVDKTNNYKKVSDIKNKIKQFETEGKKTLTLTVNRMLTGSTVEEWDTMIYLKDTASPQEYDQSIFRLQNQFIKKYVNENNEFIKYNQKPQTLLVDFDPNRMFIMQETKSLIYNANIDKSGNSKLRDRLENELRISPIIAMNKNNIVQITASDIMKYVSNYSNNRGVLDEVNDIPVDIYLLDIEEVKKTILLQSQIGTKNGLKLFNTDDEATDLNIEQLELFFDDLQNSINDNSEAKEDGPEIEFVRDEIKDMLRVLENKFKTYYARILFFAFLTDSKVSSLENIIEQFEVGSNERILNNLGIEKNIIELIYNNIDPFKLSQLDYKIQNINSLSVDESLSLTERALVAVNKFDKLSNSEIVTPHNICNEMIENIGIQNIVNIVNNNGKILDIASKEGEFTLSMYKILTENEVSLEKIKKSLYSIPTSSVAYEFTRKIYEILDLNVENIASTFNTYDLLKIVDIENNLDYEKIFKYLCQNKSFSEINLQEDLSKEMKYMKFNAVVGNPPYQENIGNNEGNASLAKQLFPSFVKISIELNPDYSSLIIPSKWFLADAQDKSFIKLREYIKENNHIKKMVNFTGDKEVFSDVNVGSVSYFLYEKDYVGNVEFVEKNSENTITIERPLFEKDLDVILPINNPNLFSILNKVKCSNEFNSLMTIATGRNAFGVVGKDSEVKKISKENSFDGSISLRCAHEIIRYIDKEHVTKNIETMKKWKIFTSKANGGAGLLTDNKKVSILGKSYIGKPNSCCTDSLIPIGCFDTEEEAINLSKYMCSKFLRFMVGIVKSSQNLYQPVYRFVPMQDFTNKSDIDWNVSINQIDEQLYKKYKLTNTEVEYIESKIKELEWEV